jgi:hypothetical protein
MTLDDFGRLAEIWGGDIGRWPASQQAEARELAATAEGAAILRDERRFDVLLSQTAEVGEYRAGRAAFAVLQRLAGERQRQPWYRALWQPARLVPAASLACSAMLGLWLASVLPAQPPESASVLTMVFDSGSLAATWVVQ